MRDAQEINVRGDRGKGNILVRGEGQVRYLAR